MDMYSLSTGVSSKEGKKKDDGNKLVSENNILRTRINKLEKELI